MNLIYYAQWDVEDDSSGDHLEPSVSFTGLHYGLLQPAVGKRYKGDEVYWDHNYVYGCRTNGVFSNMPISEYGLVLMDSSGTQIAKKTSSSYTKNPTKEGIYYVLSDGREFFLYKTNYYVWEDGRPDTIVSEDYDLVKLSKGKTYSWYLYVICNDKVIESERQSFVFN